MVIVKLAGGLGNQLFQYAFSLYLQEVYGLKVHYDISFYLSKKRLPHEKLSIKNFSGVDLENYNNVGIFFNINIVKNIFRKVIVTEENLKKIKILDNKFYIGNWQTYKYPAQVKGLLIRNLNYDMPSMGHHLRIFNLVKDTAVATLHIRGTDILSGGYGGKFRPLNEHYYLSALSKMPNIKHLIIVTDDPAYANSLNFSSYTKEIISSNDVLTDFMTLRLAKNLICANSTFSWWSGFLGNADNIFFPNDANFINIPDFIPNNWSII